jgi:hypothetical protein
LPTHFVGQLLIFCVTKILYFISLDALAGQVSQHPILVFQTGFTHFAGEFLDGVLGNASNPNGCSNQATIDKEANYGTSGFIGEHVHKSHYA